MQILIRNKFLAKNVLTAEVGNTLLSRTILLSLLCTCLAGTWMIEQPASSRLIWYPRFEWFLACKWMKVWRVGWWSRHYGALSPSLGCLQLKLLFERFGLVCSLQEKTPWMVKHTSDRCAGQRLFEQGSTEKMPLEDHQEGKESKWKGPVPGNQRCFEKYTVGILVDGVKTL